MQRIVTGPVENIANFLQRTSRQRDYSARASGSTIKELDILADAVNVMLYRMQEYMQKQREAEEQHRKLNASLEDMVSHRTTALKDANQELIQTLEKLHQFQRQIVQNEKMASLGDMVAGVAHEVNLSRTKIIDVCTRKSLKIDLTLRAAIWGSYHDA